MVSCLGADGREQKAEIKEKIVLERNNKVAAYAIW